MPSYWSCPKCKHRNTRTASRKCLHCGGLTKPKRRVAKHAQVLRDTSYQDAALLSVLIHGGEKDACAVCGRPRGDRNHDRDHDHTTGLLRGLACWKCNRELLRGHTLETLRACLAYYERSEAFYGKGANDAAA